MEAQLAHGELLREAVLDPTSEGKIIRNAELTALVEFNHGLRALGTRQVLGRIQMTHE